MNKLTKGFVVALALIVAGSFVPSVHAHADKFKQHKGTAIYTYTAKGNFEDLLARFKTSLEARQFTIVSVSDLSTPLQKNKALFKEYNKLGYDKVRAVIVCNLEINNEVLNVDLALAALCPFKIAVYSRKGSNEVTFAFFSTVAVLAGSEETRLVEIGHKVDQRLKRAIEDSLP